LGYRQYSNSTVKVENVVNVFNFILFAVVNVNFLIIYVFIYLFNYFLSGMKLLTMVCYPDFKSVFWSFQMTSA